MVERTGILPIAEAFSVVVWPSTQHQDERQQDDPEDHDNFERGEPELKLAKEFHTEVVDRHDEDQENGDPDSWIDLLRWDPIRYNQRPGGHLIRREDDVLKPIPN